MAKSQKKSKKVSKKQVKKVEEKKVDKILSVERDKFGSCKSSNDAKINAVLSKTPKSMHRLVTQAKLSGTYYEHLGKLIKEKIVVKSKDDKGKIQFALK